MTPSPAGAAAFCRPCRACPLQRAPVIVSLVDLSRLRLRSPALGSLFSTTGVTGHRPRAPVTAGLTAE